jgi:hypothetical protein
MRAPDSFRRLLAAGLVTYIGAQSILIIGGNVRLFPLTGVTLPFVSYGGSSLLTSFLALLILLFISCQPEDEPAPLSHPQPYLVLAGLVGLGLFALAIANAWWAVWRGPDLLTRTDNARRSIDDRYVKRGSLQDRNGTPIDFTLGKTGDFTRNYGYPDLASITGYTDPLYGQAGLESTLDPYLRGLQGNPASSIWWNHLVYGQPPPGLDVRLSIDLELQQHVDNFLASRSGAIVLLNAQSGEILAIASHPTYDPNLLDQQAAALLKDPQSPLLDRAAQEVYPLGPSMQAWLQSIDPSPQAFTAMGFYNVPELHLPVAAASLPGQPLHISPLQMALAASAISDKGLRPAPRLAMAVRTPSQGWVVLPALSQPVQVFSSSSATSAALALMVKGQPLWRWSGTAGTATKPFVWAIGGTLSAWQGSPLAIVVLLEDADQQSAAYISQQVLVAAMQP